MKKNVQKALAISGIAITLGTSGFILEASANENLGFRRCGSHQERILKSKKSENGNKNMFSRRALLGTVTAVGENSLTIQRGEKTFTVNISSDTRLLDRDWETLSLSEIEIGHKVRVLGTISDSTITAKTLRDVSIQ